MKSIKSIRLRKCFIVYLFFVFFLTVFTNINVNSEIVIEKNIRNAITGQISFSDTDLKKLDLNNDNKIDAADLIQYFTLTGPNKPIASFKSESSTISEHGGDTTVEIQFDREFSGQIIIESSGSATDGEDYLIQQKAINVNGTSATVNVSVNDDFVLENTETIILSLTNTFQNYFIGLPNSHTIHINENDNVWNGSMEIENMSLSFVMEIKRNEDEYKASLKSDGSYCFPAGSWPTEIAINDNSLNLSVDLIQKDNKASTLLNTTFNRYVKLISNPASNKHHIINKDAIIRGDAVDKIIFEERQYLNTDIKGTFILVKNPHISLIQE